MRVDRLLKLMPTVWPRRAERTASDWVPALIADLWEAAFCISVVNSEGERSAIERKWRGEGEAVVYRLVSEREIVETRLKGGITKKNVNGQFGW